MLRLLKKIVQCLENFLFAPFENMTDEEIREVQRRLAEQHRSSFPYDF